MTLDKNDTRIEGVRLAVLAALDAAAVELYGQEHIGWKDQDLPELFRAIDAQAERIFDRVCEGN
jgi:hypothetical protein